MIDALSLRPSLHSTSLHFTPLHYISHHFTIFHTTSLHFTPLHYTSPHFTTLHPTSLNFTPLHYTCRHSTSAHLTFPQPHLTTFHSLNNFHFFLLSVNSRHVSIQTNMLTQVQAWCVPSITLIYISVLQQYKNCRLHFNRAATSFCGSHSCMFSGYLRLLLWWR